MYAPNSSYSPQRLLAIGAVVLIHVAAIVAFKSGLVHEATEFIKPSIKIKIIPEILTPKPEPEQPPTVVQMETPLPFVPVPDQVVDMAPDTTTITTTYDKPETSIPTTGQVSARSAPSANGMNLSRPDYPSIPRRLGQEGIVTLKLHVLANGRIGAALVEKSSGFARLDEAAQNHALRQWRFKPGMENGSPIAMWTSYRVVFRLDQY